MVDGSIQERLLKFILWSNWVLLVIAGLAGTMLTPPAFAAGIVSGGVIVTVNFHLLYRTLRRTLAKPGAGSHHAVLAKYYLRFLASGIIIFFLIYLHLVNPVGLFIGLSVVVFSIILATVSEFKKLISKEAV